MIVRVGDAIRNLLPLPDGFTADDAVSEPIKLAPSHLYVYPNRTGAGQLNLAAEALGIYADSTLRLSILYTLPSKGEQRVRRSSRAITEELDEILVSAIQALFANREHPYWWHIDIELVRPDRRSVDVRAVQLDIAVRMNPTLPDTPIESGGS